MVYADGLVKTFGAVRAVDGVSLRVGPGEIYGLVGPDGAGKTTTIRLLCGALRPDAGAVHVGGFSMQHDGEKARTQIGYLSQYFSLYDDLTVKENLRFFAEVRGLPMKEWLPRSQEILEFVRLEMFTNRLAGQLSGGMRQKLGLAVALITRPAVLLLDEPTTGVDPITRQDFWELIIRLSAEQGTAVLISTPYMDEATRCMRVGFLRAGCLIMDGTPRQLRQKLDGQVLELAAEPVELVLRVASQTVQVRSVQRFGDKFHLMVQPGSAAAVCVDLTQRIQAAGGQVLRLQEVPPLFEDVFIAFSEETK